MTKFEILLEKIRSAKMSSDDKLAILEALGNYIASIAP